MCVSVGLIIQHAERMRRLRLASVACLAVPYFSTYPKNLTIFEKMFFNIKCKF